MDLAYLIPALRIILGALLVITSALKLTNLKGFSLIVASYGIVPRKLVKPLAYAHPFAELFVGCWVLSGRQLFYGALGGLALMITASFFIISALIRKKKVDNCGCYGAPVKVKLTWKKAVENLVWIVLFILLAYAVM